MIPNDKELIQAMKMVRLSEATRNRVRENLLAYADMHAMPSGGVGTFEIVGFVMSVLSRSRPILAGAFVVVLIAAMSGGAALAAEQAVPGDALYAVKVHVNEPMAAVFAGSGEAQARYHAKLAVRRVEEAEVLAKRGDLSSAVAEDLSKKFSEETDKAVAEADKLESAGDVSASIAVRADLAENLSTRVALALADTAPVTTQPAQPEAAPVARTMMAKSAAVVADAPAATPTNPSDVFRSTVAGVIARLDETRGKSEAAVAEHIEQADTEPASADARQAVVARGTPEPAPRTLLAGASIRQGAIASTTASSTEATSTTPALGRAFLKKLIRTRADGQGEEHAVPVTSIPDEQGTGLVPASAAKTLGQ